MALITKNGLENLKKKLEELQNEEQEAIKAVIVARGYGDFSENAELESANAWMKRIKDSVAKMKKFIMEATVFTKNHIVEGKIGFGSLVTLEDEFGVVKKYKLLSELESDVSAGIISITSPIAKSLQGKEIDDEVSVVTPSGPKLFTVIDIDYSWL